MEGGPGQEGEEERYLRQVMGIVEEQEWSKERQRVKRVKKKSACKEAKPGVEVEDVPQGAWGVTKVVFLLSLCLCLSSSLVVFSDYKGADTLSLRHMMVRGPHLVAMLDTITTRSLATAAKEGFVQLGEVGDRAAREVVVGLGELKRRLEEVAVQASELGLKVAKAVHKKLILPALDWLQQPRRRPAGPPPPPPPLSQPQPQNQKSSTSQPKTNEEQAGFPSPQKPDIRKEMATKIAATTAFLKRREEEDQKHKDAEEDKIREFKMLQARRREAERGK